MGYDPKCRELAEHFIRTPDNMRDMTASELRERVDAMAQVIQDTIEDELRDPR